MFRPLAKLIETRGDRSSTGADSATASAGCAKADAFGSAEGVSGLKGLVTSLPVGSASQMTVP